MQMMKAVVIHEPGGPNVPHAGFRTGSTGTAIEDRACGPSLRGARQHGLVLFPARNCRNQAAPGLLSLS